MIIETWKSIPGFQHYEASSLGNIRSWINNKRNLRLNPKILKPAKSSTKYLSVCLSLNGVGVSMNVHRIVALTFLGTPPMNKDLVLHKDDDRLNNASYNLYYGDSLDNAKDKRINGNNGVKLNEQQVSEIRFLKVNSNSNNKQIASIYHVSRRTIDRIISKQIWS